jgi:uncharacterized protein YxjI
MGEQTGLNAAFMLDQYMFRKKVFKLFGGAFHVYDKNDNVVLYSKQKAFKLKEDFRIYSDESMSTELITIKTPAILDISATYFVTDATTGQSVGALKRKGLKSIFKDEWSIFTTADPNEEAGRVTESSVFGAILSRIIKLIPQSYVIQTAGGETIAMISQHFNPFVSKYTLNIPTETPAIDRRLLIAAGILLVGIEGRQGN